ncbi:MAG: hypothetical protein QOJ69_719 [Actinomycetota bacterium]|nr:hypothetical protein [Actinomycetota bacterium]
MTVTYRTVVLHLPPTPLGLLPERWAIEHWCNRCRHRVMPEELVAHARGHRRDEHSDDDDESFQSPTDVGHTGSGQSFHRGEIAQTPDVRWH